MVWVNVLQTPQEVKRSLPQAAAHDRRPAELLGAGWAGFGRAEGTLVTDEEQVRAVRSVLEGRHPDGGVLVEPKKSLHPSCKLPSAPLVEAVRAVAEAAHLEPRELMGSRRLQLAWRAMDNAAGHREHRASIDDVEAVAAAAGVDPAMLWPALPLERARAHRGQRVRSGTYGFCVEQTVPKSVSLLYALGLLCADASTGRAVEEEFLAAARATGAALQQWSVYGLTGHQGSGRAPRRVAAQGMLGVLEMHRAARPIAQAQVGDPNLRMTLLVANLACCADGRWRNIAAGGRDLFGNAAVLGELFKACLRRRLTIRLGIAWEPARHSREWEIAGIDQSVRDVFSQRSLQIARIAGPTPQGSRWRRRVADGTGSAPAVPNAFREGHAWAQRAAQHRLDPEEILAAVLHRAPGRIDAAGPPGIAAQLWDPRHGPAAAGTPVARRELLAAAAGLCATGVADHAELEKLVDQALDDERIEDHGPGVPAHVSNGDRFALRPSR